MTGADVVRLFEEQRPVCVMAQMALERLLDPAAIDKLFVDVAQAQYKRALPFSALAKLMASVVLCRENSVNAAYKKMQEELGVSLNATYLKLDRVELGLSQAIVRYSYAQLKSVSNHLRAYDASPVARFQPKILDGNHLAGTEHRLLETRGTTAAPLPGKALVVLDPRREAIADLFPIEDGHAQERSALDAVIETIEAGDLWIADRNFCTLKFLYAIALKCGRFAIRLHAKMKGEQLGPRRYCGKTESGRVYEYQLKLTEYVSCEVVFEPAEWKSVYRVVNRESPPLEPPKLKEMVRLVAQLGGYVNKPGADDPGPQTVWLGLARTHDFALCWQTFGPEAQKSD